MRKSILFGGRRGLNHRVNSLLIYSWLAGLMPRSANNVVVYVDISIRCLEFNLSTKYIHNWRNTPSVRNRLTVLVMNILIYGSRKTMFSQLHVWFCSRMCDKVSQLYYEDQDTLEVVHQLDICSVILAALTSITPT